jgi:hypothetical protein
MQNRRCLKLAVICSLALAIPASAAATAGVLAQDGPPAKKAAKVYRDICPMDNPYYVDHVDYVGPKSLPR